MKLCGRLLSFDGTKTLVVVPAFRDRRSRGRRSSETRWISAYSCSLRRERDKAVDLSFLVGLSTGCSHLSLGVSGDAGHDLPLSHQRFASQSWERQRTLRHQIPPSASAVT